MSQAHLVVRRVQQRVVGRQREIELVVAALAAGRHVVLEGPPGTGKSTLLRAVADEMQLGFEFVEGNAELTPARLIGHFDPARVLADGYDPRVFVDGPLVAAMRDGALLYVEEINRVPEETLNVMITVMSERELHVPRLGRVAAAAGFRLVAAMNPFDAVGTARISGAIYDRVCRLSVDYQSADDELHIVQSDARSADSLADPSPDQVAVGTVDNSDITWLRRVVELVRSTRSHPDVRIGSSVRGAIDMALVARSLAEIRGVTYVNDVATLTECVSLDAALISLSGRVRLRDGATRSSEQIVTELWKQAFAAAIDPTSDNTRSGDDGGDSGKARPPMGALVDLHASHQ